VDFTFKDGKRTCRVIRTYIAERRETAIKLRRAKCHNTYEINGREVRLLELFWIVLETLIQGLRLVTWKGGCREISLLM
jgi:hypothetical protein